MEAKETLKEEAQSIEVRADVFIQQFHELSIPTLLLDGISIDME